MFVGTHKCQSGAIWSYLELSSAIWRYLELSGATGSYLAFLRAIWCYMELSTAIGSYLELYAAVCSCLSQLSRAVWSYLRLSAAIGGYLDPPPKTQNTKPQTQVLKLQTHKPKDGGRRKRRQPIDLPPPSLLAGQKACRIALRYRLIRDLNGTRPFRRPFSKIPV